MNTRVIFITILLLACPVAVRAQDQPAKGGETFENAAARVQRQLEDSLKELAALREQIASEKIPLSHKLSDLEAELTAVRQQYQDTSRTLDSRTLDLSNLRNQIKSRKEEGTYLSNLLGEYSNNFESRLHISELQRYDKPLHDAKLALENSGLTEAQVYEAQAALLMLSLDRLDEALGGTRFDGTAVDDGGLVKHGTFALVGPAAIFRSDDGEVVGSAVQRLGSMEPTIIAFETLEDTAAADNVVQTAEGDFPLDPTLGNAHKMEATHETLWAHIKKGGLVMIPICALAAASLLVALYRWFGLMFVRKPSEERIRALLGAIAGHDERSAMQRAKAIGGPVGRMLAAGVEHLGEPRELIEEIMYETVLTTRLRLQRLLPFIAISAAAAPLLGLLGTVTGIITTFKLITVFGSGDVKTLSGGISEALITTEFGLIVAIPSLLMHAFLSRKAKGVIDQMEKAAIALVNQIGKSSWARADEPGRIEQVPSSLRPDPGALRLHGALRDVTGDREHEPTDADAPPRRQAVAAGGSSRSDGSV